MINKVKHSFNSMNKDIAKSKYPSTLYYDAKNIKLFSDTTQSSFAVSNQRGPKLISGPLFTTIYNDSKGKRIETGINSINSLRFNTDEILDILGNREYLSLGHFIIGYGVAKDGFVVFTTSPAKVDGIWFVEYLTNDIKLLYLRKMGFDVNNPIQAIVNYETENIEKVYWVDGENQLRFLNIRASVANQDNEELIDLPLNNTLMTGISTLTSPKINKLLEGGTHTAGKIQYAYTLYKINGSQSKLSPLSELVSLTNSDSGGDVNEQVSTMPQILIENIDTNYTNIKIYSIKYSTLNAIPQINLIYDAELNNSDTLLYVDSGSVIQSVNISEITFAGNDLYIPKHIANKDNRLFIANYKNLDYKLDLDTRAYSFDISNNCKVYDSIYIDDNDEIQGVVRNIPYGVYTDDPFDTFDSINIDPSVYCYDPAMSITKRRGGRGKYLFYQIRAVDKIDESTKGLKDDEIYRIAIRFRNKFGQKTEPMWIADFKSPAYNFLGAEDGSNNKINTVSFGLTAAFYNWMNTLEDDQKPVGYEVLIAQRTMNDRTIVSSGIIGSSMYQKNIGDRVGIGGFPFNPEAAATYERIKAEEALDNEPLLPVPLLRNIMSGTGSLFYTAPAYPSSHMKNMNGSIFPGQGKYAEIALDPLRAYSMHWQHNKLMFQYSPEFIFSKERPVLTSSTKLKVKGAFKNTYNASWLGEKDVSSDINQGELKVYNGISNHFDGTVVPITGNPNNIGDKGLFDHPGGNNPDRVHTYLFYRKYGIENNTPYGTNDGPLFVKNTDNTLYTTYGTPEFNVLGESFKSYNSDFRYRYANNLKSFSHGPGDGDWDDQGPANRRLLTYNVNHQSSVAFMLNDTPTAESSIDIETNDRIGLNALFTQMNGVGKSELGNSVLYCEFVKEPKEWLFSNIYGGNTYENRLRTLYVQFSDYIPIEANDTTSKTFLNCGDTYVQNFRFLRMVREDTNIINQTVGQFEEIVEFPVETTIDLKNRNDYSRFEWDNNDVYLNSDYHKYNPVYSQQSTIFIDRANEYNVKDEDVYNTTILASKMKNPGELIDNWLDILPNESLSVDGRYGSINSIVTRNDKMFVFQDSGISYISVNPRIQIQGGDGIELELGKGGVLHDYQYISTESGTLNKWSVLPTYGGIYYFDTLNKNLSVLQDQAIAISDVKGLRTYFNNLDLSGNIDNPLIGKGVTLGYSLDRGIVNACFNLPNYKETLDINISSSDFISRHSYSPTIYMTKGDSELVTDNNRSQLYQMYKGEHNLYFGNREESSITLIVADNSDFIKIMNNIQYKMEAYDNGVDQPLKTLSKIRVYNEYQDSGYIDISEGRRGNARRRFRDWNVELPRVAGKRDRVRNAWNFIELVFESDVDKDIEIILHDVVVSYTI